VIFGPGDCFRVRGHALAGVVGGAALIFSLTGPGHAQAPASSQTHAYDPALAAPLPATSRFDGFYAGLSAGLTNNPKNNYYTGATYRVPVGLFAGYNYQFTPYLFAGAELQADATFALETGDSGFTAMALGRIGTLLSPDFTAFQTAGLGMIDGTPAFAVGVGVEQAVSNDLSLRAQAVSYGQFHPAPDEIDYGGITAMKIDVGALWYIDGGAAPHSPVAPLPHADRVTDYAGLYAGIYMGGLVNPDYNYHVPNPVNGAHLSRFARGGVIGWNQDLGSALRLGGEIQAGFTHDTSGTAGFDVEALARLGIVPAEGLMIYASGGVGVVESRPSYALGGGVEYALWGMSGIRADYMALGEIEPAGPIVNPGFSAHKFTLGTVWHFD